MEIDPEKEDFNFIESLTPFSSSKYLQNGAQSAASCAICSAENLGKYKCPRCSTRTCSVKCSKLHKELQKCDGQRPPWQPITGHSQFKEETSLKDQHFIQNISGRIKPEKGKKDGGKTGAAKTQPKVNLAADERYLLQNARLRRVWLRLDDTHKSEGSRHERFSDTIFWTCTVKFVCRSVNNQNLDNQSHDIDPSSSPVQSLPNKPIVDYCESDEDEIDGLEKEKETHQGGKKNSNKPQEGEIDIDGIGMDVDEAENNGDGGCSSSEDGDEEEEEAPLEWTTYTVHNIPENIRVATLLRQFLRPKPFGPVISRSQLDMSKMDAFSRASESILCSANSPLGSLSESENGDKLLVYLELLMEDENGKEEEELRYYTVDPSRTILENLRNRHVNGHPNFVVVLRRGTEFGELELPMMGEEEQKQMQEKDRERGQVNGNNDRPKWQRNQRGRGRGNNSNYRGNYKNNNNNNRKGAKAAGQNQYQQQQQMDAEWSEMFPQQMNPPALQQIAGYFPPSVHHFHPYQVPIRQVQPRMPYNNRGRQQQWRGGLSARGNRAFYN